MAAAETSNTWDGSEGQPSPIVGMYLRLCRGEFVSHEWLHETRAMSGVSVHAIVQVIRRKLPFLYRQFGPPLLSRDVIMLLGRALAHVHHYQHLRRIEGYRPSDADLWAEIDFALLVVLAEPVFAFNAFGEAWDSPELMRAMANWRSTVLVQSRNPTSDLYTTDRGALIRFQLGDMFNRAWRPNSMASAKRVWVQSMHAVNGNELDANAAKFPEGVETHRAVQLAASLIRLASEIGKPFVSQIERGQLVFARRRNGKEKASNIGPQHATLKALGLLGSRRPKRLKLAADTETQDPIAPVEQAPWEAAIEDARIRDVVAARSRRARKGSARWHVLQNMDHLRAGGSVMALAQHVGMDESTLREALDVEGAEIVRALRIG